MSGKLSETLSRVVRSKKKNYYTKIFFKYFQALILGQKRKKKRKKREKKKKKKGGRAKFVINFHEPNNSNIFYIEKLII